MAKVTSRNSRSLPYGSRMHALRQTILGRHRIAKGDAKLARGRRPRRGLHFARPDSRVIGESDVRADSVIGESAAPARLPRALSVAAPHHERGLSVQNTHSPVGP